MIFEELPRHRGRGWRRVAVGTLAALVLVLVLGLVVTRMASSESDQAEGPLGVGSSVPADTAPSTQAPDQAEPEAATTEPSATSVPATTSVPSTTSVPATTIPATTPGAGGAEATTTAATPSVTGRASPSSTSSPPSEFEYPVGPDGTPLPLIVVFDTDTITITGQVPSQAAKDRLASLAKANSQFPDAQVVDNMVINEAVPLSVGARVLELNSARFPEGSAEILPEHAAQLDRVVAIMGLLPNITVTVVGHADQRGDDQANFAISDERARAVVNYLRFLGVEQTRLSSRAAGETDLLSLNDDAVSLALNRRTEFIFYGLLVE